MQLRVVLGILTISVAVSFLACQFSEDRFLGRPVNPDELIGVWRMRSSSLQDLDASGISLKFDPSTHRIVINQDGSCVFHTFPAPIFPRETPPNSVSSPCYWSLKESRHEALWLTLEDPHYEGSHYFFHETEEGDLLIWQYIGDPDAWKYLEYSRDKVGTKEGSN